jgi:hypothetical protein
MRMTNSHLREYQEHLVGKLCDKKFMEALSYALTEESFDPDLAPIVKKALKMWKKREVLSISQMRKISPDADIVKTNGSFEFDRESLEEFVKVSEISNKLTEARVALETGGVEDAEKVLAKKNSLIGADGESFSFFDKQKQVGKGRGVPIVSGLKTLDEAMGGVCPGEVALVIGETNVGKTSWLVNVSAHAVTLGFNVYFVSLEQPDHSVNLKFDEAFSKRKFTKKKAGHLYILCSQPYTYSPETLEQKLESTGNKVDLVVIDSLDLMRSPRSYNSKWEEEGETVLDLKGWGLRAESRIWVSTQANRSGYGNAVVTTGQVKGSLEKVQLIDHVISLNPPSGEVLPGEDTTDLRLHHAKNRFGPKAGTIDLECRMEYCEFKEMQF